MTIFAVFLRLRSQAISRKDWSLSVGSLVSSTEKDASRSASRQPDRSKRKGYRLGFQVNHDFVVPQGARSLESLNALQSFFGVGRVYTNTRHDNHRENMHAYTVHRRSELVDVIVPFFRRYQLRTSKRKDFEKFAKCLELIVENRHLTREGLAEIAEIAQTMNREVSRHEMIRILRGHTSDDREND